jgi:hypothetical protein
MLFIVVIFSTGCAGITGGTWDLSWDDLNYAFNPAVPYDGSSISGKQRYYNDRAAGIILPRSHYGIVEHIEDYERKKRFGRHVMLWDPVERRFRPPRNDQEALNGIQ